MSITEAILEDASFQRAFLAVSYFTGVRHGELSNALLRLQPSARALVRRLASEERTERAQALALELERLVRSLDAQRLAG